MADNFLEKKMEEYRSRGSAPVRMTKSLEKLLRDSFAQGEKDTAYSVHPFQLQAICSVCSYVRAGKLVPKIESGLDEQDGIVIVSLQIEPSEAVEAAFLAGELVQAMVLKAAEIGLKTSVLQANEKLGKVYSVGLRIFKDK